MNELHDVWRWRWINKAERGMSMEDRDHHLKHFWVRARQSPPPSIKPCEAKKWLIEVQLNNGQRVFCKAL